MLSVAELRKMDRKPMWPGACERLEGEGDRDLEMAEAQGLIRRTSTGFVLTDKGRLAVSAAEK